MSKEHFQIIIPGVPVPLQRPRFFNTGRVTKMYDPQMHKKREAAYIISSQSPAHLSKSDTRVVFSVDFTFLMPIPKSMSKGGQNILKWLPCHDDTPDVDNLIKFYLDAANGTIWKDDSSVYQVSASKFYSDKPRVIMKVISETKEEFESECREILSMFSPEDFDLMKEDVKRLYKQMYSEDLKKNPREVAILISLLADRYGDRLKSIKTKHPQAWKKINAVKDCEKGGEKCL